MIKGFAFTILVTVTAAAIGAVQATAQDATKGERLFRRCVACHTIDDGGPNRIGPNLYGIYGADIAAKGDFRYSKALSDIDGVWTEENLNAFLLSPRAFALGTKMAYAGLRKEEDRADLIAWLKLQAPSEQPEGSEAETATAPSSADEDADLALLPVDDGRMETYTACVSCHSIKLVVQQGMNAADWNDTINWMVDEQDMEELDVETQALIVDYLSKHFGRERPNFP